MSVDNKNKPTSGYYSIKSLYSWFPVMFPNETGGKNIMIHFYIPLMRKDNFVLEIAGKGIKLCLGTKPLPDFIDKARFISTMNKYNIIGNISMVTAWTMKTQ
jgi:hypothetical protein